MELGLHTAARPARPQNSADRRPRPPRKKTRAEGPPEEARHVRVTRSRTARGVEDSAAGGATCPRAADDATPHEPRASPDLVYEDSAVHHYLVAETARVGEGQARRGACLDWEGVRAFQTDPTFLESRQLAKAYRCGGGPGASEDMGLCASGGRKKLRGSGC